jgi:hypothetical protein
VDARGLQRGGEAAANRPFGLPAERHPQPTASPELSEDFTPIVHGTDCRPGDRSRMLLPAGAVRRRRTEVPCQAGAQMAGGIGPPPSGG